MSAGKGEPGLRSEANPGGNRALWGQRWTVLLVLMAGWLAAGQVGKVPPALPELRDSLALNLIQSGWIVTTINSVTATLGVAIGLLAARLGAGKALLSGLLLLAMGSVGGALSASSSQLIVCRLLESLGFVLVVVSAPALIAVQSATRPARRRTLLVVWSCYMPLGIAVMMAIAPTILHLASWRSLWAFNAVLLVGCALLVAFRLPQLPVVGGNDGSQRPALVSGLKLPGPWSLGLCFTCYSAIWLMLITWLPTYAIESMNFSLQAATWLTAVAVLGNIGGNLGAHYLLAAGLPRWAILAGCLMVLGTLGWLVFSPGLSPWFRCLTAIIACSLPGMLPASIFAGVPLHVREPAQLAVANGIVMQCSNIGSLLGPPAIAALAAAFGGWGAGRWLIPAVAAIGLAATALVRKVEEQRHFGTVAPATVGSTDH